MASEKATHSASNTNRGETTDRGTGGKDAVAGHRASNNNAGTGAMAETAKHTAENKGSGKGMNVRPGR